GKRSVQREPGPVAAPAGAVPVTAPTGALPVAAPAEGGGPDLDRGPLRRLLLGVVVADPVADDLVHRDAEAQLLQLLAGLVDLPAADVGNLHQLRAGGDGERHGLPGAHGGL